MFEYSQKNGQYSKYQSLKGVYKMKDEKKATRQSYGEALLDLGRSQVTVNRFLEILKTAAENIREYHKNQRIHREQLQQRHKVYPWV